ncbi:hypothetical protein DXG03_004964 [Asterophora parasitica]|uniref:RRM domain-containing protein n=1 Tax=Asterophora parasitica TaxID=117018 RepID=A0A9P7KH27_9AGAR|nr:hypothetical protein DXG03_004964 [Asterophora parasitica]
MSTHSVNVSGISPSTSEAQLHDFFTIDSIEFAEKSQHAVIHFEKSSAAKTALMLNGGTLGGATLTVASDVAHQDEERASNDPVEQSDKPRAGIAAEYLAKGYALSDRILERAIEIDNKQGISNRFLTYFQSIDTSLGSRTLGPDQTISGKVQSTVSSATQQAKSVDEQKGISKTATDYYERAIASPLGQKVRAFYTSTSKQVQDIHEEARRIADQHKTPVTSTGESGEKSDTPASPPASKEAGV